MINNLIIASFNTVENIGTTPRALLWLIPLVAAISIVYKATKVSKIEPKRFTKEVAGLFGSIIVFIIVTAIVLHIITFVALT